jgi:hypothetical protein
MREQPTKIPTKRKVLRLYNSVITARRQGLCADLPLKPAQQHMAFPVCTVAMPPSGANLAANHSANQRQQTGVGASRRGKKNGKNIFLLVRRRCAAAV